MMRGRGLFRWFIVCALGIVGLASCGSSPSLVDRGGQPDNVPANMRELPVVAPVAAACPPDPDWNTPATPRKIYGNTWYVGTCGISAILILGREGHVLIDGATEKAGPMILDNLRTLGIRPEDVRYLLMSHEHLDHVGGMAALQRATGAPLLAREPAMATLARGASDRSDPQFLTLARFPPIATRRVVADGEVVRIGELALTAHATPGHTAGGTSWTWNACEGHDCKRMAYVDSLTAVSDDVYKFSDDAEHPGVLAAFRTTLERVAALPCDVLITPHPNASALWSRLEPNPSAPLARADACLDYAERAHEKLEQRIATEQGKTP